MKNKLSKIIILIFIGIMIFCSTPVFASHQNANEQRGEYDTGGGGSSSTTNIHDPINDPDYYYPVGMELERTTEFSEKVGQILGVISTVGVVCSVIVLCILGLKYMLGSVEEKAEYKKTMLGYIIGVALIATASIIPNTLYKIGKSIGMDLSPDQESYITPGGQLIQKW